MLAMRCWIGLNALNFFIAAVQTGFGPFFSVYLTEQGWSQVDIGLALSIGTASVLALQLPAGALVDVIRHKRFANGLGMHVDWPQRRDAGCRADAVGRCGVAQIVHSIGSCILAAGYRRSDPGAVRPGGVQRAVGINARYASLGNAIAAALLGALAYYASNRAVFIATAHPVPAGHCDAAAVPRQRPCVAGRSSGHADPA